MEEEDLLYDTRSMLRLKAKGKLIKDVCDIVGVLQRNRNALPKSMYKVAEKSLKKDFKKGLKIVNQRIPIFIEMPELKKEGNGVYSVDKKTKTDNENKEIVVNVPAVMPNYDVQLNEEDK